MRIILCFELCKILVKCMFFLFLCLYHTFLHGVCQYVFSNFYTSFYLYVQLKRCVCNILWFVLLLQLFFQFLLGCKYGIYLEANHLSLSDSTEYFTMVSFLPEQGTIPMVGLSSGAFTLLNTCKPLDRTQSIVNKQRENLSVEAALLLLFSIRTVKMMLNIDTTVVICL